MTRTTLQTPHSHSVVIPTSARPELLRRCLAALSAADSPAWEWDAIVVDNSPEDFCGANAAVVESFQLPQFRYTRMASQGLTAARHRGAELSSGDVVSFLDDDSFVSRTWLAGVEHAFLDSHATFVGGPNI